MGIVSEKKFLTKEELKSLKEIQEKTQAVVIELGEIELYKIRLEERYDTVKEFLNEMKNIEENFSKLVTDKYGKINLDPKTGEITNLD
jgi:ribosome-binding ATPase YchF (GTP1/OBG family)